MKANYSERVEIDVLEEPQLDFKYYVNPTQKRNKRVHPLLQPSKDKIQPKWKKPGTIPSSSL